MITLIHGNDTLTSRKHYIDQKDEESLTLDAESLVLEELEQSLGGSGLFGNTKKIFIENLFTRKGAKSIGSVGKLLTSTPDLNVYLWADKEIGVKSLASFPKFENKNFKIPQNIWAFLDGIKPNNALNVSSFHKTLNETEVEIVFAMIVRQFRLMLGLSEESGLPAGEAGKNIDEVKRLAPWQKSKLVKQASLFEKDKLKEIYKKLYKIDKKQKTGGSPLTLVQNIDILLLEI